MTTDTIVRVDPKTLLVGPNVRKEITLPAEFVASVKEHGVKIPIVAHETPDGLEVVDGQMRTLAAVDAGLAEVPVYVREAASGAERVVDQLVVNRERTSLSRRDTVAAVKELTLDFKMPAADVVKKLGVSKKDVVHAAKIAMNEVASSTLESGNIDLELAAKIAENDLTAAEAKRVVGSNWNPEHALRQVLDDRKTAARTAELTKRAEAEGAPIVDMPRRDSYDSHKNKHAWLEDLVDKESGAKITPGAHKACEGHGVYIGTKGYGGPVAMQYVCTDPAKYDHRDTRRSTTTKTPLTAAEQAQRKQVIARNKVWPGIVEVRRSWIREQLLTRTTMPGGWELLVALIDTQEISPAPVEWFQFTDSAHEFLQVEKVGYSQQAIRDVLERPNRAAAVLLGVAIARHERSLIAKDGWKLVDARYLEHLAAWGYGLSELEAEILAAAKKKPAAKK
jgi:ParB family chromosome partitioning protein